MNSETSQHEVVADIRITDTYLKKQIEAERIRRGDATATKTAGRLISERLSQIELQRAGEAVGSNSRRRRTG